MRIGWAGGIALAAAAAVEGSAAAAPPPPVILGGEVFNSSASSPEHLATLWPRLRALNINTLLAPVTWDQVEPAEGRFDFSPLDAVIAQARANDVKLGLLWLAAFKNGRSTYAPGWVRADTRRFPRVATRKPLAATGATATTPPPILSVFSPALLAADAKAFAAVMRHLKAADPEGRVILMQVENEVGLLGDSRDRSPAAEGAWRDEVPAPLMARIRSGAISPAIRTAWEGAGRRSSGSWAQVLGESSVAEETFMAWGFGRYIDQVARAGRPASRIPFYTNAWLGPQPGETEPGQYPSGGPTAAMIDVWKVAAPTLAFVSPDIYVPDIKPVQAGYDRPDNRLFIPEAALRTGELFWALGRHKALGFVVFGAEAIRPTSQMGQAFGMLAPMADLIAQAQAENRIAGVLLEGEETQTVELGGLTLTIRGADAYWRRRALDAGASAPPLPSPAPSETDALERQPDRRAFGLSIAEAPGRFLVVGQGFFIDAARGGRPAEYDVVQEGAWRDGRWVPGRWLNGDEYAQAVPRGKLGMTRVTFLP